MINPSQLIVHNHHVFLVVLILILTVTPTILMHINWPKTRSKSCQWFLLLEICVSWAFALEVNVYLLILAFSLVRILLIRPALELKGLLLLCALQGSLPVILVESFKVYVQILGGLLDLSHSTLK